MPSTQIGIRISPQAAAVVDGYVAQYALSRSDVVKSLLTEALKSPRTRKSAEARMAALSERIES